MNLVLTDEASNVYNLPGSFWIESDPVTIQKNPLNSAYAAGGKNIADEFPGIRTITINGTIQEDTEAAFETAKRSFCLAVLKGGWLTKSADVVSRRIWVDNPDIDWGVLESSKLQDVTITFLAEFPFWEDATETEDENILAGNDTVTITTTGTDFLIRPIIEIEADQGVDIPGTILRNIDDGNMECSYDDVTFVSGDLVEIDCKEGTVTRNGGDSKEYFCVNNPGSFLRLQPGTNDIEYEGNACTLRFKYRKLYL